MDKFIKIGKELIPVTEEVYKEYSKMARRERYMEKEVKANRIIIDMENEKVTFLESKEDSIERLMEKGVDFAEYKAVEDIVCDKAMFSILQEAMTELDRSEQELIHDLYYKNLTTRQIAVEENVSQPAIVKRHKKVVEKIKKYFYKFGYQNTFPVGK